MCLWDMPNNGHLWRMFILSGNCINFRFKKNWNALQNMVDFGRNYLNNYVLELSMHEFVDRDRPLDDNFNEPCNTWIMIAHARCK